jgi:hypothetical protein
MNNTTQLYFATGAGANAQTESILVAAENCVGVFPETTTKTAAFFRCIGIKGLPLYDKVVFTHNATGAGATGTGHRCKIIARAIAEACNASPHVNGIVDVIDVDNKIYLNELKTLVSDTSFGIAIVKGYPDANIASGGAGGGKSL